MQARSVAERAYDTTHEVAEGADLENVIVEGAQKDRIPVAAQDMDEAHWKEFAKLIGG